MFTPLKRVCLSFPRQHAEYKIQFLQLIDQWGGCTLKQSLQDFTILLLGNVVFLVFVIEIQHGIAQNCVIWHGKSRKSRLSMVWREFPFPEHIQFLFCDCRILGGLFKVPMQCTKFPLSEYRILEGLLKKNLRFLGQILLTNTSCISCTPLEKILNASL